MQDKLVCVLFYAQWCAPCRFMKDLLRRLMRNEAMLDRRSAQPQQQSHGNGNNDDDDEDDDHDRVRVRCFWVDIDEEVEFFEEWNNKGVPFVVFYFNGKQLVLKKADLEHLSPGRLQVTDGGVVGALRAETLSRIINKAQARLQPTVT